MDILPADLVQLVWSYWADIGTVAWLIDTYEIYAKKSRWKMRPLKTKSNGVSHTISIHPYRSHYYYNDSVVALISYNINLGSSEVFHWVWSNTHHSFKVTANDGKEHYLDGPWLFDMVQQLITHND